jgi:hypothetical protein
MRDHWRDPNYWVWWWKRRVSGQTKGAVALMVAVAFGIGGYLSAERLATTQEAATFTTQRVVTVVRKTRTNAPPEVVTKSQTTTHPGETEVGTVRRDGRTVVVRAPGEKVTEARTVRGPVHERVVTNARTDTVVQTVTVGRPTTVTTPGPTETVTTPGATETVTTPGPTETREVTQPVRTVTETVTETDALVVVTVTEVVVVTVPK